MTSLARKRTCPFSMTKLNNFQRQLEEEEFDHGRQRLPTSPSSSACVDHHSWSLVSLPETRRLRGGKCGFKLGLQEDTDSPTSPNGRSLYPLRVFQFPSTAAAFAAVFVVSLATISSTPTTTTTVKLFALASTTHGELRARFSQRIHGGYGMDAL
ncbi:hypothetical protein SAY87_023822 [Trapa incisa]|uniref:Uncharacterized protein n=1 Tax=Trapa incisa TaxID=236973 RepID=A0AAN7QSI1_9MYRT|nr:hypothetical protein SAY87_023822 [Trapa incisa]